jgi:PAS domain S-box-containing protein
MRETETSYRSLVENLPQNIFRKDLDGRFTFANSKFCATINRPKSEIIGKTDCDLFPPDLAAKYRADDLDVIVNRKQIDTVERHHTPDGLIYVHVMKTPLFDAHGKVVGLQGIFWDETERYQAHEQISKARDSALQSARLKSEFLANMSHEIRTPMNAIIGMTGLLLQTSLGAEQRDFADTIRTSADSLLTIINDILDFSKIEAGKLTIETIDFDLSEVIEGASNLLIETAHKKGLRLATQIHEAVPRRLCGDPGRLRQILTNLLGNAVKFTDKGEVILDVTRAQGPSDLVKIRFEVRDTGIGISRDAQPRLFEAFSQADGSMTRRYGGTGLGLAITKQLVELMRGKLGFTSEVGHGSTFWFELPLGLSKHANKTLMTSTARRGAAPASTTPADHSAKAIKSKIRLLLAEDNAVNQKVALRQLSKLGYEVDAVNNGLEAVRALERQAYPVILMDCQMPELDGYKATQRIREMQNSSFVRWPHKPYIIAMTANALAGDREACLAVGMDDYISKPVRLEQLDNALQRGIEAMENASKSQPADEPLLDSAALDNLRALRMEGEPDPLAELVQLFINDTPGRIAQIQAALKKCAAHDLEAAAHSLKGSASNLGARTIAAACGRIMQHARNNEFAPATNLLKSVEADFAKVKDALLEEVKR